jgi:molybdate transport system ATP-binding protein
MSLRLERIRLPLSDFALELSAELTAAATGVFGPSGAGKTSLLDLIAGLRRAPSAYLALDGRVLANTAKGIELPPRQRRIGYIPQDGALFPHLPVRGNLLYGHRRAAAAEGAPGFSFEHVAKVLELEPLLDRRIAGLSGGERQRVALGRALLSAPRLLLLDEPLSGLDAPLRERILPYLRRVRDEFAVPMVYVSHQAEEIVALCDEVLVLERGKVIARGAPEALFRVSSRPRYELALDPSASFPVS